MKRTIRLFTVAAMLAVFAAPALAQTNGPKECNDEVKSTLYNKWYENRTDHQDVAYQAAKEYLTTCPADESDQAKFLKKWVGLYENAVKGVQLKSQLDDLYGKKDYAGVMNVGKQLLALDPNNLKAYILLGYIGNFTADSNPALAAESANYAKKAIEMVEAGKTPENWQNFSKDEVLAWLNHSIGLATAKSAPADALPYLLKSVRYESPLKKDPLTYVAIEQAYENGPYTKLSEEYKTKYGGKDETPESKLALENINQIVDRMIDAYARAAALSTGNDKKTLMEALTEMYKGRNKSEAGVNELVAGILSKPVPDVPTPLTSLPTPAPTPTPVATGSQTGTPATATSGTQANKSGTTTTGQPQSGNKATGTAKPTPTPAKPPVKPRARANHRRRG
jgi:cell division septation protein DedD